MSKIFAHLDGNEDLDLEYIRGEFVVRDKSIAELVAEVKALDEAVVEAREKYESNLRKLEKIDDEMASLSESLVNKCVGRMDLLNRSEADILAFRERADSLTLRDLSSEYDRLNDEYSERFRLSSESSNSSDDKMTDYSFYKFF